MSRSSGAVARLIEQLHAAARVVACSGCAARTLWRPLHELYAAGWHFRFGRSLGGGYLVWTCSSCGGAREAS